MIQPEGLEFEHVGHVYHWQGQRRPSVTQVLKDMGLVDYSKINQETLRIAAARGTAVHVATQLDDEDDLDEATVQDEIMPYLLAYRRFRLEMGFQVTLNEARGYDAALGVAGTLDRTGFFARRPKSEILLDIKSGILLEAHRLQVTAYTQFLPSPRKYRRCVLQLQADATYKLTEFPLETYADDLGTWQAAVRMWYWQNDRGLLWRPKAGDESIYV